MTSEGPLRVLLVEDSPTDVKLVLRELKRSFDGVDHLQVSDERALRLALEARPWDIVLSDWTMPTLDALGTLAIVRELKPELPLIVVSGTVGEERAASAMRAGARDYVLKDGLIRLGEAVRREVRDAGISAENRRRRAEDDRFFNLALELLCIRKLGGQLLRINPGWERLLGWSTAELLGQEPMDLVHPDDRPRTQEARALLEQTGHLEDFENRYRCKDGSYRSLLWSGTAFPDEQVAYLAGRDVTGRRNAEETLRRQERNFRALIEGAPVGLLVLRDGKAIYANAAFLEKTLLGHAALLERWPREVVREADQTALAARLSAFTPADHGAPFELRLVRPGKRELIVEASLFGIDFDGGHAPTPAIVLAARDVTAQRELQKSLMFADRMVSLGTLAAGVAHEINNPLAYIQGNLDFAAAVLAQKSPTPAVMGELDQALKEARDGTTKVRQLVRDLKTFSRPEDETLGPLDLGRVLESAAQIAAAEIRHRARVVKELSAVPPVLANEARLGQVFLNLLINAAQAIPEGKVSANSITLRTFTAPDGRAVASVRDTGAGMSKETQSRIFDPFFTTKPVGVGTGLGLAICHGIVSGLGGEIRVKSGLGEGTEISVYLLAMPAVATRPAAPAPVAAPREATRRGKVLVVDDEPRIGQTIRRILQAEHDVEVLQSGRAAIERVTSGSRYDVILCDLMMPDATGMEVHLRLLEAVPDQAERMIFLTGGAVSQEARTFLDRVSNTRMDKPFSTPELCALVSSRVR